MNSKGFNLIELLIVIAIIGILGAVAIININNSQSKARDGLRIFGLNQFAKALDQFYLAKNKYSEYGNGTQFHCYSYALYNPTTQTCGAPLTTGDGVIKFGNSAGGDWLYNDLSTAGITFDPNWNDPLDPTINPDYRAKYNCRYIILGSEQGANTNYSDGDVQQYTLHCRVENRSTASVNDGGSNPMLFEIQKPNRWLCITDNFSSGC